MKLAPRRLTETKDIVGSREFCVAIESPGGEENDHGASHTSEHPSYKNLPAKASGELAFDVKFRYCQQCGSSKVLFEDAKEDDGQTCEGSVEQAE